MYDLIIIGSGPAGLTSGIYAKTFGLNCILLNNLEQPPQVSLATEIVNFPGFEKISGSELLEKMKKHAQNLGLKIINERVVDLKREKDKKIVITEKNQYETKTIIIATGARHRKANILGEAEFLGKGVSYCAPCDGYFYKGKDVVVWGGGDTALSYAAFLKQIGCKTVTLVHRRDEFRAAKNYVDKAKNLGVKFVLNRTIKEIKGNKTVEKVVLDNKDEIKCSAVFIAIGEVPAVELVKKIGVATDENGFIITDMYQSTSVDGIFAAGDVTITPLRQVITACSDGAKAAFGAFKYLEKLKK